MLNTRFGFCWICLNLTPSVKRCQTITIVIIYDGSPQHKAHSGEFITIIYPCRIFIFFTHKLKYFLNHLTIKK
jgi:hypothetical protein